jgi:hypothetical protein
MKPLLRAFLAVDAVIVLLFGLLFVCTPWWPAVAPLKDFASSPALIGQLLGVVLLGLSFLQAYAAANGALSVPVGRITGHTMWIAALVVLVWLVAIRFPVLEGRGLVIGPAVGIALLVLGLIQARLGGAVSSRERREAEGAASAERVEARVQGDRERDYADLRGRLREPADPYMGQATRTVSRDATEAHFNTASRGAQMPASSLSTRWSRYEEEDEDPAHEPMFAGGPRTHPRPADEEPTFSDEDAEKAEIERLRIRKSFF